MLGKRIINTAAGAAPSACTTDTVQILDGVPLESIATYQLDGAATSIPNNTYPGTFTNPSYVTGKFGQAAVFNGSSSKILASVPKSSNQSFSFWTKHGTQSNSTATYLGYSNTGSNGFFSLCISSGNFSILYWNGSTYARNTSTINIADNTWHHVILNTVGNVFTIYLDGNTTPVYTTTLSGFTHAARNDLQISFETPDGAASYFNGSIDQVRIFDRAITATEVTTLYNEVQCIPTIVPTDHFNPVLYDGNDGTQSISSLDFQPDFVWIKARDFASSHELHDSVRGEPSRIFTNNTNAASTNYDGFVSLDSNGFSLDGTGGGGSVNDTNSYVSWNWKAGGAAVSNTDGTITSQVSANVDAGFSIVKWTTTAAASWNVGHGLDTAPEMIISKMTSFSNAWEVYHKDVGTGKYLQLASTAAAITDAGGFSSVTDTTWTSYTTNTTGNYIAYCFNSVDGFSRIGSYVGTGASNSIVTGFRPAYVMIKKTNNTGSWTIIDNKRDSSNPIEKFLKANDSSSEGTASNYADFNSNGFTLNTSSGNNSGDTFIYLAFAEENVQPEPELANSFNVVTYTGNGSTQAVTGLGFQPDLVWIKSRSDAYGHILNDSVRGANRFLYSNTTEAEDVRTNSDFSSFDSNGFTLGTNYVALNGSGKTYVAWAWKASNDSTINQEGSITSIVSANPAAGFSVVKFNGSTTGGAVGHGLDYAPELIIAKKTSASANWFVLHKTSGSWRVFEGLNTSNADADYSAYATVTDSVIDMVDTADWNTGTSNSYINYCFHSVAGYQKVGSYTGNGSSGGQTITGLGFNPRFLLVKNATSSAAWRITDSERGDNTYLYPNLSNADDSSSGYISLITDGFRMNGLDSNTSDTFIYLAIA